MTWKAILIASDGTSDLKVGEILGLVYQLGLSTRADSLDSSEVRLIKAKLNQAEKDHSIQISEVRSIKADIDRAEQDRMHAWLVQINPSSNHNDAKHLYEEGTGDWIFRSREWNSWINKQSKERSLWIHGIPGAGKTILASHIIEQLIKTKCLNSSGNVALVYYYCYHGHNRDETFSFLRWLVSKLCRTTDTVSSLTYDMFRSGEDPDVAKLLFALHAQLDGLDTVYVAVDALDESQQPRDVFLRVLHTLATDPLFEKIRLLTTSREYADIERVMAPISFSVPTYHEEVEKDIRVFVEGSISRRDRFKRWPDDLKVEVIDALAIGAKGMFRWAVGQLDILRRLKYATHEDIRQTIKSLPKNLDETYMRILNLIEPDDLELVRFTIHWIIYTEGLLDLALDSFDNEHLLRVPEVLRNYELHRHGSLRQRDQVPVACDFGQLKDCCGCLVSFFGKLDEENEVFPVCKLSHYTVKEFLQSDRFKPADQLVCLDLATTKTYLPNLILRILVEGDGCHKSYPSRQNDLFIFMYLVGHVLQDEEHLDLKLVLRAFLIVPPGAAGESYNRKRYALSLLQGIQWVGERPSDEIIVLLRLLAVDALHLSRALLETAGSHLLRSSLSLKWYDFHVYTTEEKPVEMVFEGNIVEFVAVLFGTSPSALLFLLENYFYEFEDSVDLDKILQSYQNGFQEMEERSYVDLEDEDYEAREKLVQKLHNLGAVSTDVVTEADLESGMELDLERDDESKAEPAPEAGTNSQDRPKSWLDVVLRNESKGEVEL